MYKGCGVSKNRRERVECKAHGTQRQRHIMKIGEGASTAQRSNRLAQQIIGDSHG
jgi:hypothetical protein